MAGKSFTADSADITLGSEAIRALGEYGKALSSDFRMALADTSWTGEDSYGTKLKGEFVRNRDAVQATIDAICEGIEAIGGGTMSNLGTILNTQSSVIESINQQGGGGSRT